MPMTEKLARQHAPQITKAIQSAARANPTEAQFRKPVEEVLAGFAEEARVPLRTHHEYSVATGRADTVYNRLIIEYKRPGHLSGGSSRNNTAAVEQTKRYIEDIERQQRIKKARLVGVVTDGRWMIYCRYIDGRWRQESPVAVDVDSVGRLLTLLVRLQAGAAMVPSNLIEDFGSDTLTAQRATRALYSALQSSKDPLVQALFEQWQVYFGEVTGHGEGAERLRGKAEFKKFAKGMGLRPAEVDPPHLFFSVHTYFALLIKFIAWLTVSRYLGGTEGRFQRLGDLPSDELKAALRAMERGETFRAYGLRNLLEGDFFAWYLKAWDDGIERQVRAVLKTLDRYDPGTLEEEPELTRDLLKQLYQYLMPRHLRHDLGEYYTPDWLAQRVLNMVEGGTYSGNPRKRVLDPACGSGTFLVLAIRATRDFCRHRGIADADALELILTNIVGIDLNPLAVIAARTNYLLALGDLLEARSREPIEIPIYLADSILTPGLGSDLFSADKYQVRLAVLGEPFLIPKACATREGISALAEVLDRCIETGATTDDFLAEARGGIGLSTAEYYSADAPLTVLYERLAELHRQGLDGLWARIIKNAFAPVFLERFDYVVGNPPWVNWQNLPGNYRQDTTALWQHYGLFHYEGLDTVLGKAKKDISMLMTYVAVDRYLRHGGVLGFVITQTVFKTSGAGQGFRRFVLADGTYLEVAHVDDMSEIKPFPNVGNRTGVIVLRKQRQTRYPVPYTFWQGVQRGRGRIRSIPESASLEEVADMTVRRHFLAGPIDVEDATSAWISGRRQAISAIRKICGASRYEAHAGVYTGGANGVFWLNVAGKRPEGLLAVTNITEGAKRKVEATSATIESDLIYPLLRGRDVSRWVARPSGYILLPHTQQTLWRAIGVKTMQTKYPRTYRYLQNFEVELGQRRSGWYQKAKDRLPFYIMFAIGNYTFATYKVVWRYIASEFTCAVIADQEDPFLSHKVIIPDHRLIMISCETPAEAYYLCAMLNSTPSRYLVQTYMVGTQISTHVLHYVQVPDYDPTNLRHDQLGRLAIGAHAVARSGDTKQLSEIEEEIDHLAAQLWGLTEEEVTDIQRSLEELR